MGARLAAVDRTWRGARRAAGLVALAFAAGCGRVAFEPLADGTPGGASDAALDGAAGAPLIRFAMDDDPSASQRVGAEPAMFTAPCGLRTPQAAAEHVVGSGAYSFDGTTRVELPGVIDTSRPYTITAWLKPEASLVFGSAIGVPLGVATIYNDISLTFSDAEVRFEGYDGVNVKGPTVAGNLRGAWHHYAMVWTGQERQLAIDGAIVSADPLPYLASTFPLAIGADLDNDMLGIPYAGLMDDLRIYPRALTATEIAGVQAAR